MGVRRKIMADDLSQALTDAIGNSMAPYIAAIAAMKLIFIDLTRFLAAQPGVDRTLMYEFFRSLPDPPGDPLVAEMFTIVRRDMVHALSSELP
jgi:hypothetical protein